MRCTLHDLEDVQIILSNPAVFYGAKDDGVTTSEGMAESVLSDPSLFVLKPHEGMLFLYKALNYIMYEVHVVIVPESRGKGVDGAIQATRWMFENTPCRKLITHIPVYHQSSIMFAQVGGMKRQGILTDAFLHNGTLFDMAVLELTRDEFYTLHGD